MVFLFASDIWLSKYEKFVLCYLRWFRRNKYLLLTLPGACVPFIFSVRVGAIRYFVVCFVCLTMRIAAVVAHALRWSCIDLFFIRIIPVSCFLIFLFLINVLVNHDGWLFRSNLNCRISCSFLGFVIVWLLYSVIDLMFTIRHFLSSVNVWI